MNAAQDLFWSIANELHQEDPRVVEGTIMNGRCLRVGEEFLALVDYKGSGLVVKLPRARVSELIERGEGRPFGPAGKIFAEWVSVPTPDGPIELTVPAGTSTGARLRIKGRGVAAESGAKGDLYAVAKVVVPRGEDLLPHERGVIEEIGRRQPSPRTGREWH